MKFFVEHVTISEISLLSLDWWIPFHSGTMENNTNWSSNYTGVQEKCTEDNCQNSPYRVCQQCSDEEPWVLCAAHDTEYHSLKNTRGHKRIEYSAFCSFHNSLFYQFTDQDLLEDVKKNLFMGLHVHNNEAALTLGPKFHHLGETIGADSLVFVVSCYAPTGSGKSFLLRSLLKEEHEKPLAGRVGSKISVSSDIHAYQSNQLLEVNGLRFPVLFLDSEGIRGAANPLQGKGKYDGWFNKLSQPKIEELKQKLDEEKTKLVSFVYPRILYMFSDVICYPFAGAPSEIQQYSNDLLEFASLASARTVNNPVPPMLIIIFNKRSPNECNLPPSDDFSLNTFLQSTNQWIEAHSQIYKKLKLLFQKIYVIHIPNLQSQFECITQLQRFQLLIRECLIQNFLLRQQKRALQHRKELFPNMWRIARRLNNNNGKAIDLFKLLIQDDAIDSPNDCVAYMNLFWKLLFLKYRGTKNNKPITTLCQDFKDRVAASINLRWFRYMREVTHIQANHVPKKLPIEWEEELKNVESYFLGFIPCTAKYEFDCVSKGKIQVQCKLNSSSHTNFHESSAVYYQYSPNTGWISSLFFGPNRFQSKCQWGGSYVGHKGIYENYLVSQVKSTFEKNLEPLTLPDYYRAIPDYLKDLCTIPKHSQICLVCLCYSPDVTLRCSHSICKRCYHDFIDSFKICPICKISSDACLRNVPQFAGYRILSLDGGGTRGIILLKMLSHIESKTRLSTTDLFDLIIGTSAGGIVALYLVADKNTPQNEKCIKGIDTLKTISPKIFSSDHYIVERFDKLKSFLFNTNYSKHNGNVLRENLKMFINPPMQPILGCTQDGPVVAVTAVNVPRRELVLLSNTIIPNRTQLVGNTCSIIDAAMATSAAPTYFPFVKLQNNLYIDGGMGANCPAVEGLKAASSLWEGQKADILLSIGTGKYQGNSDATGNILEAIEITVNLLTDSEKLANDAKAKIQQHYPNDHKLRFYRINPTLPFPFPFDDVLNLDEMEVIAEKFITANEKAINALCGRLIACQLYVQTSNTKCAHTFKGKILPRTKSLGNDSWDIMEVRVNPSNVVPKPSVQLEKTRDYNNFKFSNLTIISEIVCEYNITITVKTPFGVFPISGCPLTINFDFNIYNDHSI